MDTTANLTSSLSGKISRGTYYCNKAFRYNLLFQIGDVVQGVINKLGKTHIGCVVLHCFNASIHRPNTEGEFHVGQQVLVRVTELFEHKGILSLRGNLVTEA